MMPSFFPISKLTDGFFSKLSKRKCSVSFVSWSSLKVLSRNLATFSISPLRSCFFLNQLTNTWLEFYRGNKSHLFHVLVEHKVHIWMMALIPRVNNMRKIRRVSDWKLKIIRKSYETFDWIYPVPSLFIKCWAKVSKSPVKTLVFKTKKD